MKKVILTLFALLTFTGSAMATSVVACTSDAYFPNDARCEGGQEMSNLLKSGYHLVSVVYSGRFYFFLEKAN